MATWKIHRFHTDRDLYDTLNGAINCKPDIADGLALDGLTLIISAGAGDKTVTFAPALSRRWTPEEIVAEIEAADASLVGVPKLIRPVGSVCGKAQTYLRLGKDNGTVVTIKSTGTANALFGLSITVDTVGVPYTGDEVRSRIEMIDNRTWAVVTYK